MNDDTKLLFRAMEKTHLKVRVLAFLTHMGVLAFYTNMGVLAFYTHMGVLAFTPIRVF